jgi:predicted GNAT family acetyltransferase
MSDTIVDNKEGHRFEMAVGDDMAVAYYSIEGGKYVLLHTEVPLAISGQGVGSRLARLVFDEIDTRGARIIAKCPFMSAFAARHPEYNRLVDG